MNDNYSDVCAPTPFKHKYPHQFLSFFFIALQSWMGKKRKDVFRSLLDSLTSLSYHWGPINISVSHKCN